MKTLLKVVGWIVGIVILIAVAVSLFFDVNRYKPEIERAVANSTGMTLKINGKASLRLFPRVHIALQDVHLLNRGSELFAAREVQAATHLFPLVFRHEVVIDRITLDTPKVQIEKSPKGEMNFQFAGGPQAPAGEKPAGKTQGRIASVSVKNGDFSYRDRRTGQTARAQGLNVDLSNIAWSADSSKPDPMKQLIRSMTLQGDLQARSFNSGNLAVSDIKAKIHDDHGLVRLDPTKATAFGGMIQGSLQADLRGREPKVDVKQSASRVDLAQALPKMKGQASGTADGNVELHASGKSPDALLRSATGAISVRSTDFATSIPIDELAAKIKSGNVMGLVQLGSSLFFGAPLGSSSQAAGTAGGTAPQKTTGKLVSDWKISNGVAETQNVALSTGKTTIAFKGDVNLVTKKYQNFYIASVDPSGCAREKVQVEGSLMKPRPVASSIAQGLAEQQLGTLLGPSIAGAMKEGKEKGGKQEQPPEASAPQACDQFVDPETLKKAA